MGWLGEYRKELGEWGQIMELVTTTEKFVREKGLYRGSHEWLEQALQIGVATATTVTRDAPSHRDRSALSARWLDR